MKGAETWDRVVRYETSLLLHLGCGFEPDASSALLFCGTSGMEDMKSLWASQTKDQCGSVEGSGGNERSGRTKEWNLDGTAVPWVDS